MQTLKFISKCILASVPAIILIAFTLLSPFCYMDEEFPAWRFKKQAAAGHEYDGADFDTVILGDSGAMSSLIPEGLGSSCINLAAGGATSIEMYYFFSEYLDNHAAPKNVVIMFAPFHYWHIDNYKTRTVYFKAIPLTHVFGLYAEAQACNAGSVLYDGYIKDEISARLGLPNKYLPAINAAGFVGRLDENTSAYSNLVRSFGWGTFGSLEGCYDESYETSYDDMVIDGDAKLITLYMQKLLRLCDEKGIKVILLQPAVNPKTFEGISEHYYGSYRNYIKQLGSICENIDFETGLRVYDGKYFADTSHLNPEGAAKFTEEIRDEYMQYLH